MLSPTDECKQAVDCRAVQPTNLTAYKYDIESAITSFNGSKEFMKLILPVTVINILYYRTKIDRCVFQEFEIKKGKKLMSFQSKSTHKNIRDYHVWMKGALDALDKSYLESLILLMKDEEGHIEHYKFQFKYLQMRDSKSPNKELKIELNQAIDCLMDQIKSLQKYEKLNGKIFANVEFTFYNEVTPLDYIPPNFYTVKESVVQKHYESSSKDVHKIALGTFNTGYHSLKCTAYGTLFSDIPTAETCVENIKSPNVSSTTSKSDLPIITCICETMIKDQFLKIRICDNCNQDYHIACHGYFIEEDVPQNFICNNCAVSKGLQQDHLYFGSKQLQTDLCLLRLAIVYSFHTNKSPDSLLENFPLKKQDTIVKYLKKFGVLTDENVYISGMEDNSDVRMLFQKLPHSENLPVERGKKRKCIEEC